MSTKNFKYRKLPLTNGAVAEISYNTTLDKLILAIKDKSGNVVFTLVTSTPVFHEPVGQVTNPATRK